MEQQGLERPVSGTRAWGSSDIDDGMLGQIGSYIVARATEYYTSPDFQAWDKRTSNHHYYVNQELPPDRIKTRWPMVTSIMRNLYDAEYQKWCDVFNVDDFIMVQPESKADMDSAREFEAFINRLLKSIRYKSHLFQRFSYLPIYGISTSHDVYEINSGFRVKPMATSAIPGIERLSFKAEWDVLSDRPTPQIVRPRHRFGDVFNNFHRQQYQGDIYRAYNGDFGRMIGLTDESGAPVYNVELIQKRMGEINKGAKYITSWTGGSNATGVDGEQGRKLGGYADIYRYYGPLEIPGLMEALSAPDDSNQYYVECFSDGQVIRFQENPADRFTPYTHFVTHPLPESPFGRSILDSVKVNQHIQDGIINTAMEMVMNATHQIISFREDDLVDPRAMLRQSGIQKFVALNPGGIAPQSVSFPMGDSFRGLMELRNVMMQERQFTMSDQEIGAMGAQQQGGKTATQSRIQNNASSMRTRSMMGRVAYDGMVPQIRNIAMLALANGNDEVLNFWSNGKPVRIGERHAKMFLSGSFEVVAHDRITTNGDELAQKLLGAMGMANQFLGQIDDKNRNADLVRYALRLGGMPDGVVDTIVPPPLPPELSPANVPEQPIQAPGQGGLPPGGGAPGQLQANPGVAAPAGIAGL